MLRWTLACVAGCALLFAGCGGDGDRAGEAGRSMKALGGGVGGGGGIGGTGIMHMLLTDAPACGYDQVNVTIDRIRVNQNAQAGNDDPGWSDVVLAPPRRVDLLTLKNGVMESLGEALLAPGTYRRLRLVLAGNSRENPLANSVVPSGGAETALSTPAGSRSGIEVGMSAEVAVGQSLDLVLDFDACRSVVQSGRAGRYSLKPVIRATPLVTTTGQAVVGHVDPAMARPTTMVSVQQGGVVAKATVPDATGRFTLYPVPAGRYDLVVTAEGRVTAVMTGVPVDTVAATYVSSPSVPIVPGRAPSGTRGVKGAVSPATAMVRALQTLDDGSVVEVANAPVNAQSGAFAATLPIDAPQRTAYVASPESITFTDVAEAAGLYSFEAASAGVVMSQGVDARAKVAPLAFTFP
jgi:hypothetical protein